MHYSPENLWRNFAVWAVLKGYNLPDWKQFYGTPKRRIKGKFDQFQEIRKIRESIPDWMDALGEKELGKAWDKELSALNQQAEVILRCNRLKTEPRALRKLLSEENIETRLLKGYPDALQLVERKNVFVTKAFKKGLFEVQDASSQKVAPLLEAKPGQRVIDTCAGAGGKTLHLASQMQNKGQLIAMDIYQHKLAELKKRAKRAGAHNIETRVIKGSKTLKKLKNSADRVLIDAPCSGMGVLKRNPDSKWKLEEAFIARIQKTQSEILDQYAYFVKDGGRLVYATCSILPSENEQQVEAFLSRRPEFKLTEMQKISAADSGYDGFFMAALDKE